jgi:heavy metal sensor kinase
MKTFSPIALLRSLRVRLVMWTVALEAILLLICGAGVLLVVQISQDQQIEATLRLGADALNTIVDTRTIPYSIEAEDSVELTESGIFAWVLNAAGDVVTTVGDAYAIPFPSDIPPLGELSNSVLPNGRSIRLLTSRLIEDNQYLGTLVLGIPLRESKELYRRVFIRLGLAIPFVLLLSAVGGLFLANRALSPVTTITNAAREINATDLSRRLDLNLPNDEIGALANTFDGMLARLEAGFQRERQLTSDVSHELRTPLGILKAQLSLARSRPRDTDALLKMMLDMEADVNRMTTLVEQMLTLSRVEQYGVLTFTQVDLSQILQTIVAGLELHAQSCGVTLILELPPHIDLNLQGDEERLRAAFTNLLENAIKYSSTGGHVRVSALRQWGKLTIQIADEGIGIATEHLPHLFERFYRADSDRARESGGFGLGLAIAHAIVQTHGGEIQVASEVGKGTTFKVVFPL